jgi:hypothetical protein
MEKAASMSQQASRSFAASVAADATHARCVWMLGHMHSINRHQSAWRRLPLREMPRKQCAEDHAARRLFAGVIKRGDAPELPWRADK